MHPSFQQPAILSFMTVALRGSGQAQTLKRVGQADFGKAHDGSLVKLITLRNAKGMSAGIKQRASPATAFVQ